MAKFKLSNSPLSYFHVYEQIWKFYGIFDIQTESQFKKLFMKIFRIGYLIFFSYIGFMIQLLSVVNSQSIADTIQIFFVNFAYLNAVVKTTVVHLKRKKLQELWSKLNDADYKVVDQQEHL